MLEFVDGKLWIKLTSPDPAKGLGNDALAQRFRRIFDNVRNYSRRGVSFAKVVQQVDKLHFSNQDRCHRAVGDLRRPAQARGGRLGGLRR
jgi:type I restriction enzyme M protein